MIISLLCVLVSYIPALLLFFYLRNLRKDDPEYRVNCRKLLFRGILCSFGVSLLALIFNLAWNLSGLNQSAPLIKEAFKAFILAAFVEELVKYLTANKMIRKNMDHISWLDCIAYVAIVGIGFHLIETLVYVLDSNPIQILVRGLNMGHPSYGMLMGYFIGKALYTGKKSYRAAAFGLPFLIHGLYDFSLSEEFLAINDNLVFLPFIFVILELFILIRGLFLIRKERRGAKYTEPVCGKQIIDQQPDQLS